MCVYQADGETRLDMLFEHVPSILGCLSPKNSLSCLITFMVNIVKNGHVCQVYGLNFFPNLQNMMI